MTKQFQTETLPYEINENPEIVGNIKSTLSNVFNIFLAIIFYFIMLIAVIVVMSTVILMTLIICAYLFPNDFNFFFGILNNINNYGLKFQR
jgi:uncharacterized membrane protein